jgi:hypothetical protein
VNDQEFERARKCRYPESNLTEDNITIQIKQKIVIANQANYGIKKL